MAMIPVPREEAFPLNGSQRTYERADGRPTKTQLILKALNEGKPKKEAARLARCSLSQVYQALRHHPQTLKSGPLPLVSETSLAVYVETLKMDYQQMMETMKRFKASLDALDTLLRRA